MQVLSINVGRPRALEVDGRVVRTSIYKSPVTGPVAVHRLNLAGDEQSDLTVHGGPRKAIYVYPAEHYPYWREQLGMSDLPYAAFGENLVVEGLLEDAVHVGDTLAIGSAEFVVTQPRMPCYKLAIRFGRADMIRRFLESGRSGFYLGVAKEGTITAGDAIGLIPHTPPASSIAELFRARSRTQGGTP